MVDPPGKRSIDKADLVSASGQFPWPPAGNYMAVYGQDLMAADTVATPELLTNAICALKPELLPPPDIVQA